MSRYPIFFKSFFIFFFLRCSELVLIYTKQSQVDFDALSWTISLIPSFLIIFVCVSFVHIVRWVMLRNILLLFFSLCVVILILMNIFVYLEFGEFISVDMILFVCRDPWYLLGYYATYMNWWINFAVVVGVGFFYFLFRYRDRVSPQQSTLYWRGFCGLACILYGP